MYTVKFVDITDEEMQRLKDAIGEPFYLENTGSNSQKHENGCYDNMDDFRYNCQEKFKRRAKENSRSLMPWKDMNISEIHKRLNEEMSELSDEIIMQTKSSENYEAIMDECLDVANFAWFIYQWAKDQKDTV